MAPKNKRMKLLAKARDVRATARDEPDFSTLLEEVELSVESHDDDDSIELAEEAQPLGVVESRSRRLCETEDLAVAGLGISKPRRWSDLSNPSTGARQRKALARRSLENREPSSLSMRMEVCCNVRRYVDCILKRHLQQMKATMKRATKRFHTTMNPPCGGGFDAGFLVSGGERHMGNLFRRRVVG